MRAPRSTGVLDLESGGVPMAIEKIRRRGPRVLRCPWRFGKVALEGIAVRTVAEIQAADWLCSRVHCR